MQKVAELENVRIIRDKSKEQQLRKALDVGQQHMQTAAARRGNEDRRLAEIKLRF